MLNRQQELGLGNAEGCRSVSRRQRRLSRAHWWFERMRQVVDRAMDWAPAPEPRPEQTWFPNAHTAPTAAPKLETEERQICA